MNKNPRHYVIGMAGHIDHGKTALVKVLTGIDTDRLKEEKERGITIDLGFAHLSGNVTIIDVPGHERLIKNMVAGVSTIDMVLFVIAADDGIMPQTREHLDIINLLGITKGVFIITKTDLADPEWVTLIEQDVRQLLQDTPFREAPILRNSIMNPQGASRVKQAIFQMLEQVNARPDDGIFRLPVDRVFSKAGFGSVITGSVISGSIAIGDSVEIMPEGLTARIRGLQTHDSTISGVHAGFRAAVNLAGVELQQLHRGQVLVSPGYYEPVKRFYARVGVLTQSPASLKNAMRVRLHLHTTEVMARVILPEGKGISAGAADYAQLQLEQNIYASNQDRFIVRQYSPQVTLGGGTILETNPPVFRKRNLAAIIDSLKNLESPEIDRKILACFSPLAVVPLPTTRLQITAGLPVDLLKTHLHRLETDHQIFQVVIAKHVHYISTGQTEAVIRKIGDYLSEYHQKYSGRKGITLPELYSRFIKFYPEEVLKIALRLGIEMNRFGMSEDWVALAGFQANLSRSGHDQLQKIDAWYRSAGFDPPAPPEVMTALQIKEKDFREFLNILRQRESLIIVDEKIYLHAENYRKLLSDLKAHFQKQRELKVADFKQLTGTTRKTAIPLLTYLDNCGLTRREGDVRLAGPNLNKG